MLHSSKDTLRYVKLFGALKSILRGCGVAVAGREQEDGNGTAAEGSQDPPPGWKPEGCPHNPVPTLCGHSGTLCWDSSWDMQN